MNNLLKTRRILSDLDIERRCRYRLGLHGLRLHKERDDYGRYWYYISKSRDDERPEDNSMRWMKLDGLLNYCERLEEKDREYAAEMRSEYLANKD